MAKAAKKKVPAKGKPVRKSATSPALKAAQKAARTKAGKPAKPAKPAGLDAALMAEGKAAHAVRPGMRPGATAGVVRMTLPFNKLFLGENYRKHLSDEAVEDMAASILAEGVLENLLVYPANEKGLYEVNFGGRRYRAIALLVKRKQVEPSYEVPVAVKDVPRAEGLALQIIENIFQEDVHPVDEAAGFARLRDEFKWTTTKIAEMIGGSDRLRYVQQRLNIADKLDPAARKDFLAGEINLDQARALWAVPLSLQRAILPDVKKHDMSAESIRHTAQDRCANGQDAVFNAALYTGEKFTSGKDTYYVDVKQFARLQSEAIKARIAELKTKWSDVIVKEGYYLDTFGYVQTKDRAKGLAFVLIEKGYNRRPYDVIKKIAEGYYKTTTAQGAKAGGAEGAAPAQGLSKAQLEAAHHLKTMELGRAVADALNGHRIGMALTVIALLKRGAFSGHGNSTIKLEPKKRDGTDLRLWATPVYRRLAELLKPYADDNLVRIKQDAHGNPEIFAPEIGHPEFFARLIDDLALPAIYAAAIACHVGSFHGFTPHYGDEPLAVAVAHASGATLEGRWTMTKPYLDGFRRQQLDEIARACIGDAAFPLPQKKADAVAAILAHPARRQDWLPPELAFGDEAATITAVSALLNVALPLPAPKAEEDDDDDDAEPLEDEDGDGEFDEDEEAA